MFKQSLISLIGLLLFVTQILQAQIYSTTIGGNWFNPSTWQNQQIPTDSNDVVILGTVGVNATAACRNLLIETGGTLQNTGNTNTMVVHGNIFNKGIIKNHSFNLILRVKGDITNQGIWTNHQLWMDGTGIQQWHADASHPIAVDFIYDGITGGISSIPSICTFQGTRINLNNDTLLLFPGAHFKLTGSNAFLKNVVLISDSATLETNNGAYLQNGHFYNLRLQGKTEIGDNNVLFFGTTVLLDTLQNYGSGHVVRMEGDFYNYGLIRDQSNYLKMYLKGNVYNLGIWNCLETYLDGSQLQEVSCQNGGGFGGSLWERNGGKGIRIVDTLRFLTCRVDFNYDTVYLPDHAIIDASGTGADVYFREAIIITDGGTIKGSNGRYFQSITLHNATIRERFRVGDNQITMLGSTTNLGIIENFGSGHFLNIPGDLRNIGILQNGQATLDIYLGGSLYHNGLYRLRNTTLNGSGDQYLHFGPGDVFEGERLTYTGSGRLLASSDLSFSNTMIDINFDTLFLFPNAQIRVDSGYFIECVLHGDKPVLTFLRNAYIQDLQASNAKLQGEVAVRDNDNIFHGRSYLNGSMRNVGSLHTVHFNGDLIQNGKVYNGETLLTVRISGNLINRAPWDVYETYFMGNTDQDIHIPDSQPMHSVVYFVSGIPGTVFTWYKNGLAIPGGNNPNLKFDSLAAIHAGTYQCISNLATSRLLRVSIAIEPRIGLPDSLEGCSPFLLSFSNLSLGDTFGVSWHWDFGDGQSAHSFAPLHTYDSAGTYYVSLQCVRGPDTIMVQANQGIHVFPSPVAAFEYSNTCAGDTVFFLNRSEGIIMQDSLWEVFANSVIGFSTQWDTLQWSALQALGPPDVYPTYGDYPEAWAHASDNAGKEFVILGFPEQLGVTGINVYETWYPGSIDTIKLRNAASGEWVIMWSGNPAPVIPEARILQVRFPALSFPVDAVRITQNTATLYGWSEIDAVSLTGVAGQKASYDYAVSWDVGDDGIIDSQNIDGFSAVLPDVDSIAVRLTISAMGKCIDSLLQYLKVLKRPSYAFDLRDTTCCVGDTLVIIPTITGTEPMQYQWFLNGNTHSFSTDPILTIETLTNADTGLYSISVSNACGTADFEVLRLSVLPCANMIGGKVVYGDELGWTIDSVKIVIKDSLGNNADSLWIHEQGEFLSRPLVDGSYEVHAFKAGAWRGANATDALLVLRHFVNLDTLVGLVFYLGDVNLSGYVNATDAFLIAKRYTDQLSAFPAGDWIFKPQAIQITGQGRPYVIITGGCAGDVNLSAQP